MSINFQRKLLPLLLLILSLHCHKTTGQDLEISKKTTIFLQLANFIDTDAYGEFRALFKKHDFDPNYICTASYHTSLFSIAAMNGNIKIARYLLKKGADINKIDHFATAMHKALSDAHFEFGLFLLKKGYDPRIEKNIKLNKLPLNVIAAFPWCKDNKGKELFKKLAENGMDLNSSDRDGARALVLAVYFGNTELIDFLYGNGADMNKGVSPFKGNLSQRKDVVVLNNYSPLMMAVHYDKHSVVKQLLSFENVDRKVKGTKNKKTALDIAIEKGDELMIGLLK
ncbi:MAG: hypothetical protein COB98_04115 [Flavobacteriaceae bacterium]|nr:MAG: hypothetical protein COB98_04115 [Flavobacteriaceae bacterium]